MVRKNNSRIFLKFDEWKSSIHIIRKNEANEVSIEPLLLHTIKNLTLHKLLQFTNLYEYPVILNYNHAL